MDSLPSVSYTHLDVYKRQVLKDLGASELTWPVELNSRELGRLPVPGELVVYGRLPMMVSAQCIHKGTEQCDKKPEILVLKDRKGAQFPVKNLSLIHICLRYERFLFFKKV